MSTGCALLSGPSSPVADVSSQPTLGIQDRWRESLAQKGDLMTTQSQPGESQPLPDEMQTQAGETQPEAAETKDSKTQSVMSRWPRDLTDLWGGSQPFGTMNWPFRDIKAEEFTD